MKVNKRVIRFLIIIVLFTININVFALDNNNLTTSNNQYYKEKVNNYTVLIEDDEKLIDESKIKELAKEMSKLTKYGNIIFKSTSVTSSSTEYYAREYYHQKFGTESGTLFLIDMNNRYIYIFSDGYNYKYITKDKALIITDNIYKYASRGDYYTCAVEAYKQMNTILSNGKIAEPMRYISSYIIALIVSCFICYAKVFYDSKNKAASNNEILKNCDINYIIKDISIKETGQESEYSPISDSSDSGSSSSGGGFSGGGSSGGGGGHRF